MFAKFIICVVLFQVVNVAVGSVCDFETDDCDWKVRTSYWKKVPAGYSQGPRTDGTSNSTRGHYLIAPSGTAQLESSSTPFFGGGHYCLSFNVFLHGNVRLQVYSLNLFWKKTLIYTTTQSTDSWRTVTIDIKNLGQHSSVVIEASFSDSSWFAAIDDLSLNREECKDRVKTSSLIWDGTSGIINDQVGKLFEQTTTTTVTTTVATTTSTVTTTAATTTTATPTPTVTTTAATTTTATPTPTVTTTAATTTTATPTPTVTTTAATTTTATPTPTVTTTAATTTTATPTPTVTTTAATTTTATPTAATTTTATPTVVTSPKHSTTVKLSTARPSTTVELSTTSKLTTSKTDHTTVPASTTTATHSSTDIETRTTTARTTTAKTTAPTTFTPTQKSTAELISKTTQKSTETFTPSSRQTSTVKTSHSTDSSSTGAEITDTTHPSTAQTTTTQNFVNHSSDANRTSTPSKPSTSEGVNNTEGSNASTTLPSHSTFEVSSSNETTQNSTAEAVTHLTSGNTSDVIFVTPTANSSVNGSVGAETGEEVNDNGKAEASEADKNKEAIKYWLMIAGGIVLSLVVLAGIATYVVKKRKEQMLMRSYINPNYQNQSGDDPSLQTNPSYSYDLETEDNFSFKQDDKQKLTKSPHNSFVC